MFGKCFIPLPTLTALALAASMLGGCNFKATPQPAQAISDDMIRDYLLSHPDVLRHALDNMQAWEKEQRQLQMKAGIAANRDAIMNFGSAVEGGNPAGNVTIIEFLDYNCSYCKAVVDGLNQAVTADGKVRVVYKMLPILGEDSVFAAQLVLAAKQQGGDKALALHDALLATKSRVTKDVALSAASKVGLDVDRAIADLGAPAIASAIEQAIGTAKAAGINGTPTFLVGEQLVVGALTSEAIQEQIDRARHGRGRT